MICTLFIFALTFVHVITFSGIALLISPYILLYCFTGTGNHMLGCQPDEPLASLVTTNRIINVYGFLLMMLLMYAVLHCLHSVGNKITTTNTCPSVTEVTLMDMGKICLYQSITKYKKLKTMGIILGMYLNK